MAITVAPKVAYYSSFDANRRAVGDPRLVAFFEKEGWRLLDERGLTAEGGPFARRYAGPGCDEGAQVIAVSPNGQDDAMVRELVTSSSRLFYVHRGMVTPDAPRLAIMDRWLGELAQSLGLTAWLSPSPVVIVVEPVACRLESTVPWQSL